MNLEYVRVLKQISKKSIDFLWGAYWLILFFIPMLPIFLNHQRLKILIDESALDSNALDCSFESDCLLTYIEFINVNIDFAFISALFLWPLVISKIFLLVRGGKPKGSDSIEKNKR